MFRAIRPAYQPTVSRIKDRGLTIGVPPIATKSIAIEIVQLVESDFDLSIRTVGGTFYPHFTLAILLSSAIPFDPKFRTYTHFVV